VITPPRRIITTAIEIAESLERPFTSQEEVFLRALPSGRFRTRHGLHHDVEPPIVRKWEMSSGLAFDASPDAQIDALFEGLALLGPDLAGLARACQCSVIIIVDLYRFPEGAYVDLSPTSIARIASLSAYLEVRTSSLSQRQDMIQRIELRKKI
jgi:hypothetical protein